MTISATTQGLRPGVCLSTAKPVNPFDGQVIYMTDVDQTAVWDGTTWTVLAPIAGGRNVVINGAMQVHQRGTSTAGITALGYYTADRFSSSIGTLGTWTQSVENDAPTGSGFRKSLKMLCTTADASPATNDYNVLEQKIEGQNLQRFAKGTASAKPFSLSFWVKSNVTGTYIAELFDADNTRQVSFSYTVSVSATWEKKTITFPADTTGAFDNDAEVSLTVGFWLGAGTGFSSGTLQNTWVTNTSANRAVGQTNLASATSNYWQVTGVQLEVGAVATPFEFEDIGMTLAKCQRYYQTSYQGGLTIPTNSSTPGILTFFPNSYVSNQFLGRVPFVLKMRATPTIVVYSYTTSQTGRVSDAGTGTDLAASSGTVIWSGDSGFSIYGQHAGTLTSIYGYMCHFTAQAEL
jgi:hypothetical protein